MSDDMRTYNQHLAARNLSEALLMKYAQEAARASFPMYGDAQVEEAFQNLADRLGYRVSRVVPEISPVREPAVQAAE